MAFLLPLAVGAGVGLLIGGQKNVVNNHYTETVNQSIKDTMSAKVTANANSICNNEINVKGATCCTFQFGDQYCESSAVNEVTSTASFQRELKQDLFSKVKQTATAKNEKFGFGQSNTVSNHTNKTLNLSVVTAQTFDTECSKNAYGTNKVNIEEVYCGQLPDGSCQTKAQPDFVTGSQSSSVSAMGNCAANFVANNAIAQQLTSLAEQDAKASNVGIDPMSFILMFLMPILVVLFGPLIYKFTRGALSRMELNSYNSYQNEVYKSKKTWTVVSIIMGSLIVFFLVLIWPLGWSRANGYIPFAELDYREAVRKTCDLQSGTLLQENYVINRFMWVDPECITSPSDVSCTSDEQKKSYQTCGIYSKSGVCKSALLAQHKVEFEQISQACDAVSFLTQDRAARCDQATLTKYILPRRIMGGVCRRCENRTGDKQEFFGFYSGIKNDKKDDEKCKAKDEGDLPDECFNGCVNLSSTKYFAAGTETINGEQVPKVCGVGEADCLAKSQFVSEFPEECATDDYMQAKQKFFEYKAKCAAVNLAAKKQAAAGETLLLSEQCPPSPFDYFNCDPATFECSYTAQNTSNPLEVAACKNDFTLCDDDTYLADKVFQKNLDDNCASKKKFIEDYEVERVRNPYIFIGILVFLILFTIFSIVKAAQAIPGSKYVPRQGLFG